MINKFLALFLYLTSSYLHATNSTIKDIFKERFYSHYSEGECGKNTLDFLREIKSRTGTVKGLRLITVENIGSSGFGLVNAEATRGQLMGKPSIEETNWYYHAFVMDDEGNIYDFDFTISPTIVHIKKYIHRMFLDETECLGRPGYGEFCIGTQDKMNEYKFTSVKAETALRSDNPREKKSLMKEVVKNWEILIK